MDHAEVRAELDRVGVTFGKAGAADYVQDRDEGEGGVALLGPPRSPRLIWRGSVSDALRLLESLDDDAGVGPFWVAFGGRNAVSQSRAAVAGVDITSHLAHTPPVS